MNNRPNDAGLNKIAIIAKIVGVELVSDVIKRFDRETILLIEEKAKSQAPLTIVEAVKAMREFNEIAGKLAPTDNSVLSLSDTYDQAILADSPEARQSKKLVGFQQLDSQAPEKIADIIKKESPMEKAIILRQLSTQKAQEIMGYYPAKEQAMILVESNASKETDVKVLEQISAHIERRIEGMLTEEQTNYGAILNLATALSESSLDNLLEQVPEHIANDIRANAITFSDILAQDKKVVQRIMGAMDTNTIAYAVCRLGESNLEIVMSNISASKREDVQFALDEIDKSDDKAFEESQGKIIRSAKSLREAGDIVIVK